MIWQIIFWASFVSVVYIYFLYPLILAFISLFYQKPLIKDHKGEYLPKVSLIMAAYNEEAYIERKINNCLSLDYPANKLEIIIGSDGSDDRTNEIVNKYSSKGISFYPYPERRGKMAVINDSISYASGEICVFTDVSELFDTDAVKKLVRNFVDPGIGAVTGNHTYNPSDSELGRGTHLYWRYQRWLQCKESRLYTILSCDGTIYACRRNLFIPQPMGIINDDKAIPLEIIRQGYRVIFEPEAIARGDVLHDTKLFFKQKVRGQAGMYQIFRLFGDMFLPKNFKVWFIFMSHALGPVMVPWLLLLLLVSNTVLCMTYPYNFTLALQIAFYALSVISVSIHRSNIVFPLVHIPYFFMVSNVASLVAFWSYIFNSQIVPWTKVE